MKLTPERWAPPGFDLRFEKQFFFSGLAFSVLYSCLYLLRLGSRINDLYAWDANGVRILLPDASMPPFAGLLEDSLSWFAVLAAMAGVFAVWHYASHWHGSKSIYLMRRLPDRWELHRRCLVLPALEAALCALCAVALFWLYFGLYVWFVPEPYYVPGQLSAFWR